LRLGRIGENGKRAGEKAFDNGSRKPVLLALGAVALIPIEAISLQSHGSRKDRQLYRQMSIKMFSIVTFILPVLFIIITLEPGILSVLKDLKMLGGPR